MDSRLLTHLAHAGVVERSGRRRTVLRVAPRFLAHAERTAHRLGNHDPHTVLATALEAWPHPDRVPPIAAVALLELMQDREQMGALPAPLPGVAA